MKIQSIQVTLHSSCCTVFLYVCSMWIDEHLHPYTYTVIDIFCVTLVKVYSMAHFLTIIVMLTLNKLSLTCNRLYKRTEVRKKSMRVKNVNKHLFESVSTIMSWGVNLHFNTYTKSWFWLCKEVLTSYICTLANSTILAA